MTSYNCWIFTEVCEKHCIFFFRLEENPKQKGGEAFPSLYVMYPEEGRRDRTRIFDSSPRQTTSLFNRAEQVSEFKSDKTKIARHHQGSSVFPKLEEIDTKSRASLISFLEKRPLGQHALDIFNDL